MNQKLFPTINVLHIALCMGPFLFFITILLLQGGLPSVPANFSDPFIYVAIAAFIGAFSFTYLLYPGRINKISEKTDAQQKIADWRTMFIVRCAVTEGAALVCIVGMLLMEYDFFVYLFIPLLILQISYFPTKNKVQNELALSQTDSELL